MIQVRCISSSDYDYVEYFKCKHCSFISQNRDEIHNHLTDQHLEELGWREVDERTPRYS